MIQNTHLGSDVRNPGRSPGVSTEGLRAGDSRWPHNYSASLSDLQETRWR